MKLVNVVRGNAKDVALFSAASHDRKIVVSVAVNGASAGVQLSKEALDISDDELASRIVRLNTLAYMHRGLEVRLDAGNDYVEGAGRVFLPSPAQVAAYAATLDF